MKVILILVWFALSSAQQLPKSPADSLLPKKTSADTSKNNVKLKGGALIDTINSEKYKRGLSHDSIQSPRKPKQEN